MLQRFLTLPETAELDTDAPERLAVHAAILRRKPMLAAVFRECHELLMEIDLRTLGRAGLRLTGAASRGIMTIDNVATDVVPGSASTKDAQT